MHATIRLLATKPFPNFFKRSLDEFKKQASFAIKLEALERPKYGLEMWNFTDPISVEGCVDMSDSDIGGFSTVNMQHVPGTASEPPHLHFSGEISNKLPTVEKEVARTGYAAFRTRDRPPTMFGKALWNCDRYKYLALRVKADERKYKVNVQTESVIFTDIHQHRLYARRPGRWETILIEWNSFVRTNHGLVVEPQSEIMKEKIRTVGIGLTDRKPGPFSMSVSRMWACNGLTAQELEEAEQDEAVYVPKHFLGTAVGQAAKQRV